MKRARAQIEALAYEIGVSVKRLEREPVRTVTDWPPCVAFRRHAERRAQSPAR